MNYNPYSSPYGSPYRANYGVPSYGTPNYMAQPQQPQMQPQTQMQPQPQATQYDMPIQDIRFVTTEEAKAFIVMPNSTVLLIDKASGRAQLKSADNMGQSASKHFRFEEINADGTPVVEKETPAPVDFSRFLTREDLESMGFITFEKYNELCHQLDALKKQVAIGKANGGNRQAQQH